MRQILFKNTTQSIDYKVIFKIKKAKRGSLFFTEDFLSFGSAKAISKAISKALERLVLKDRHQPQSINPIPPDEIIKEWEADYNTMLAEMIYGDAPSFRQIIQHQNDLKAKINAVEWTMESKFTARNTP